MKINKSLRHGKLWLLGLLVQAGSSAAQLPITVPVPKVTGPIPVTEDSYPQMAAAHMQTVVDLGAIGYVEEEYFISGEANVYDWAPDGSLSVRSEGAPYTTRILVRRPADPARASGSVIVELVNNARAYDWPFLWALSWEHFAERGDVWVGLTHLPAAVDALERFDSGRYAPLSFANPTPGALCEENGHPMGQTEEGLRWDMVSQLGALLKSGEGAGVLGGIEADYVYATTHYGELSTYVNAVHDHARLADGGPVYDGYFLKTGDYPVRINQCAEAPAEGDPRQVTRNVDVPVIRMISQGDVPETHTRRREDSDAPDDRYRLYEVAGAPHMDTLYYRHMPSYEDQEKAGQTPYPWNWPLAYRCTPDIRLLDFPVMRVAADAAFANLDLWVREGTAPPRAERIELIQHDDGVDFALDEYGNALGGVRSAWLEVPAATWHSKAAGPGTCQNLGWKEAFSWERMEELYGSPEAYLERFGEAVDALVEERWLTPRDGERIKEEAVPLIE